MPNPTRDEVNAEIAALEAASMQSQKANAPTEPLNQQQQQIPAPINSDLLEVPAQVPDVLQTPSVKPITPEPLSNQQAAPEADEKGDDRERDAKYWEQRFKTVEGMSKKQAEQFEQQMLQQQQIIELLQKQTATQQPPAPEMPTKAEDITEVMIKERFGEDKIEDYGIDILANQLALENRLAKSEKQLSEFAKQTQEREQTTQAQQAEHAFWSQVSEAAGVNADQINSSDPGWADYLDRDYRRERLQAAMAKGDAVTVAREMREYVGSNKQASTSTTPSLPSVSEQAQPQVSAQAQQTTRPTVYTQTQVNKYYDDRTRGRLQEMYTPEQIQQMERQIHRAVHEGRVVPG